MNQLLPSNLANNYHMSSLSHHQDVETVCLRLRPDYYLDEYYRKYLNKKKSLLNVVLKYANSNKVYVDFDASNSHPSMSIVELFSQIFPTLMNMQL